MYLSAHQNPTGEILFIDKSDSETSDNKDFSHKIIFDEGENYLDAKEVLQMDQDTSDPNVTNP